MASEVFPLQKIQNIYDLFEGNSKVMNYMKINDDVDMLLAKIINIRHKIFDKDIVNKKIVH